MRLLLLAAMLAGCADWTESESNGLRILDTTQTSGLNGETKLRFDVLDGETSFLVSVNPPSPERAVFLLARSPSGDTVFDVDEIWASERPKTGAQFTLSTVSLNWPIQEGDADLVPGAWRVDAGLINQDDRFAASIPADIRVVFKRDSDLSAGDLSIRIVYVGPIGQDDGVVSATESAVAQWETLYARFGISLAVRYANDPSTEPVGAPGLGSRDLFERLSAESDIGEITIVIAEQIENFENIQGYAGGVPGPILPSGRSVMVLSARDNAGGDLVFSDEETRLLAETMAHEVGHFIGLFHPVELEFDSWDGLDDTQECASQVTCYTQLGENLMFPIPVCPNGICTPQTVMTDDQRGVMHRSVWVN